MSPERITEGGARTEAGLTEPWLAWWAFWLEALSPPARPRMLKIVAESAPRIIDPPVQALSRRQRPMKFRLIQGGKR